MKIKKNEDVIDKRYEFVRKIIQNNDRTVESTSSANFHRKHAVAWAPANIALCKYWGKRNIELNLPINSSLSISLCTKGTYTKIIHLNVDEINDDGEYVDGINKKSKKDVYMLNGKEIKKESQFYRRMKNYLDLFRPDKTVVYSVDIKTNIPVAAGLASSSCGFASIIKALNGLYEWKLDDRKLSILARIGSGSACRSLWNGFVLWNAGGDGDDDDEGLASFAEPVGCEIEGLRIGLLTNSTCEKSISSREAMQRTVETSPFYSCWKQLADKDLQEIKTAIKNCDFKKLGIISEQNSLAMHALMQSARPPIIYSFPETLANIERVFELRRAGMDVFFTQDAGSNLKILFLKKNIKQICAAFPKVEIINPFEDARKNQVILVDEDDSEIGFMNKIECHFLGTLHRAFSVVIVRKNENGGFDVLLQKRSKHKYHSAMLWSNTCCGHPLKGMNLKLCATERLKQEMGIVCNELVEIGISRYNAGVDLLIGSDRCQLMQENEVDHVFIGFVDNCDDAETINYDFEEVDDCAWENLDILLSLLDKKWNVPKYTPWLKDVLNMVRFFLNRSNQNEN